MALKFHSVQEKVVLGMVSDLCFWLGCLPSEKRWVKAHGDSKSAENMSSIMRAPEVSSRPEEAKQNFFQTESIPVGKSPE